MRPPAIEKMGYYPTHDRIVEIIKTYINPASPRSKLLDPCCGEGTAAALLGAALNCVTWGCELSYKRSELASKVMDKVHLSPWESTYITPESIPFMFLNPPYDTDLIDQKGRLELDFLRTTTPAIVRGGLLVYIVPQKVFAIPELARKLASDYEKMVIGKYTESVYKQVIVLANKRSFKINPTQEEIEKIQSWATEEIPDLLPAQEPLYSILDAPTSFKGRAIEFIRKDWTDGEIVDATMTEGAIITKDWEDLLHPHRNEVTTMQPAMPLKKGHIAMIMASGMLGVMRLHDQQGNPILIKGRVIKEKEIRNTTNSDGEEIETVRDKFVTTITTIGINGLEVIDNIEGLTQFMKEQGDQIAQYVLENNKPLYNFDPTPKETGIVDSLGLLRKPIPGQKPGLVPAQKHAAIALARVVRNGVPGNVQGEMGVGKTTIAIAALDLLQGYPALVVCPPHLVNKWIREIEQTIPGAKARELYKIGKTSGEKVDVNDVRKFLDDVKAGKLGNKPVAVVANTSAKMGPGWRPAVSKRVLYDSLRGRTVKACCCPVCGTPLYDAENELLVIDEKEISSKRLFCQGIVTGRKIGEDGKLVHNDTGDTVWGERICNNPLFTFDQTRRNSIAEYIKSQCKGAFKLLIGDEMHQFKGKSSDRGIAFHQLVTACKWTISLTGTLFGGKSTSIFWLLHRLNYGVRRDYAFNEEMRWARLYGVLETTRKSKKEYDDDDGAYTGNRRYRNQTKEQPGISPAIINRLLPNTIFLTLKDLGVDLPLYTEEIVPLDMVEEQLRQYKTMESSLLALAKEDSRYLSSWLQNGLARPNSAFRNEKIYSVKSELIKKELMDLPAVIGERQLLPKEKWLQEYCLSERHDGRKVLVYLRQTGTRDIQDHIKSILESGGLRVTVLAGSIDPRKREDWIAKRTPYTDVLVCNPKLVETGLDLVDYNTVVFAETEYSLYTMWQAIRRVWRLGQTKPVKAVFSVYNDSLEEKALRLMGRKMKAAQLLYGDEVGGALVPAEEGDFLTQLARDVLSGKKLADLTALFAEDVRVKNNPTELVIQSDIPNNPIAVITLPSQNYAKPKTWDEWLKEHGESAPSRKRTQTKKMDGQESLF